MAREYRDRQIPMDVIVLDWQYWDKKHWGQKSFNQERFPDPQLMMQTLHNQYNTRLMISVWPKMSFWPSISTPVPLYFQPGAFAACHAFLENLSS